MAALLARAALTLSMTCKLLRFQETLFIYSHPYSDKSALVLPCSVRVHEPIREKEEAFKRILAQKAGTRQPIAVQGAGFVRKWLWGEKKITALRKWMPG